MAGLREAQEGSGKRLYMIQSAGVEFVTAALRNGANPRATNSDGASLIHIARRRNKWDIVYAFIDAGVDVDEFNYQIHGRTALSAAAGFGNLKQVYKLMQDYGADPTIPLLITPRPELVGSLPILKQIFHRPIHPFRYPEALTWQKKCQEFVLGEGITPLPNSREKWREQNEEYEKLIAEQKLKSSV